MQQPEISIHPLIGRLHNNYTKATILVILLPKIVAFNVHMSSISSLLLPRISPHTFAFILISSMCLSSRNRSIYAVFRHLMPHSAPLCKSLHHSRTGVPWQMKNIFIIVLPRNALICKGFWGSCSLL